MTFAGIKIARHEQLAVNLHAVRAVEDDLLWLDQRRFGKLSRHCFRGEVLGTAVANHDRSAIRSPRVRTQERDRFTVADRDRRPLYSVAAGYRTCSASSARCDAPDVAAIDVTLI